MLGMKGVLLHQFLLVLSKNYNIPVITDLLLFHERTLQHVFLIQVIIYSTSRTVIGKLFGRSLMKIGVIA